MTGWAKHSGRADRSVWPLPPALQGRGGGYVLLRVGAVAKKRDETEEASGSRSGEPRNSRASVKLESFSELRHQNRLRRALACPRIASAQTRRQVGRKQGLKILAREVTNIKAQNAPRSQADWLWDCLTPRAALTGTSVFASAVAFSRKNCNLGRSFSTSPCATAHRRRTSA